MKSKKLTIFWLLIFLLSIGMLIIYYNLEEVELPPDRPSNVPSMAIWVGGSDGGTWIDVKRKEESSKNFRCKLFADVTGVLIYEGDYVLDENREIDENTLRGMIVAIPGSKILLSDGHYLETSGFE